MTTILQGEQAFMEGFSGKFSLSAVIMQYTIMISAILNKLDGVICSKINSLQ